MITPKIINAKRMRLVCGLRQLDVWAGTGITPARLSAAENGRVQLEDSEMIALEKYLQQRWQSQQRSENALFGEAQLSTEDR